MKRILKDTSGFTLLEFVVVVALAAALIGLTALLITKGRAAANFSTTQERLRVIATGLSEYAMFANSLPQQAAISTTWPTELNTYVEPDFRDGGSFPHGYQCDVSSQTVTLQTPAFESAAAADGIMQRLVAQSLCTSNSIVTANNEINCVVGAFAGAARCR